MSTNDEGATPDDEGLDLEGALNGALDGLDDAGTPPSEVDASTADPDETSTDEGEESDDDQGKDGRERDENGRFVAKNKDGEPDPDKAAAEGEDGDKGEAEGEVESGKTDDTTVDENGHDITKPPTSWKTQAAAEFAKLPESVRREVHKREEDFHRGIEQYRGAAQFGSDIAKEFQPYQAMLEQTKIAPSQLVNAALQFEYTIRTGTPEQRVELIRKLANAYGVELSGGAEEDDDGEEMPPLDPRLAAALQEVNTIKSKLTEREQRDQEDQKRAEDAERQAIRDQIKAFSEDPKNEFYGQVKNEVLQLIKSGQGADLRDAYDKAIWINPVTRKTLLARQAKVDRDKAAESAAAAKKANQLNVRPRATPPGKTSGKGTVDEALNAALDEQLA